MIRASGSTSRVEVFGYIVFAVGRRFLLVQCTDAYVNIWAAESEADHVRWQSLRRKGVLRQILLASVSRLGLRSGRDASMVDVVRASWSASAVLQHQDDANINALVASYTILVSYWPLVGVRPSPIGASTRDYPSTRSWHKRARPSVLDRKAQRRAQGSRIAKGAVPDNSRRMPRRHHGIYA